MGSIKAEDYVVSDLGFLTRAWSFLTNQHEFTSDVNDRADGDHSFQRKALERKDGTWDVLSQRLSWNLNVIAQGVELSGVTREAAKTHIDGYNAELKQKAEVASAKQAVAQNATAAYKRTFG